jgi:hypothetical protein
MAVQGPMVPASWGAKCRGQLVQKSPLAYRNLFQGCWEPFKSPGLLQRLGAIKGTQIQGALKGPRVPLEASVCLGSLCVPLKAPREC